MVISYNLLSVHNIMLLIIIYNMFSRYYILLFFVEIFIKLSVPFNGDVSLIDNLYNEEIGMFYGQISEEVFGGGRSVS